MKIFRMTPQREVILNEISKCKGHPTADMLYERIRKKLPRISLATVYRNLEILSEAGKIRKLEISGRQKRFDRELGQHHHIYCVQCHRVDNIKVPMASPNSATGIGYRISGCRIEFFGICPDCQKKNERKLPHDGAAVKLNGGTIIRLSERQRDVLHALECSSCACTAKDIAAAVTLEPAQVSCQLTVLKKKGLVASPARCQYELTDAGKKLL